MFEQLQTRRTRTPTAASIRAVVLGQVVGGGVWGMNLEMLMTLHPQMDRQKMCTTANKLVTDGWLFKVGGGKQSRGTMRFFAELADAQDFEARAAKEPTLTKPPTKRERLMQERLDGSRAMNARQSALKQSNRVALNPVITERTRHTFADTPLARFAPTGPVAAEFGALPPGMYPAAASGWAAAVTGQMQQGGAA